LRGAAGTATAVGGAALAAGGVGVAAGQSGGPYGGWFGGSTGAPTDNYDGTEDRRGQDQVSVEVGAEGNGGPFAFEPAAIRIDPGTTVTFEWTSDTHNVVVQEQPDGADWGGTEGGESTYYDTGYTYTHTFDTEGIYKYYCQPHLAVGMKGAVVVGDADVGEAAAGEAGEFTFRFTPALGLVAGSFLLAVLSPLVFGAFLLFRRQEEPEVEYEGPTRRAPRLERAEPEPAVVTEEAPATEPVQELEHDEFDPLGTASLVALYFVVLVLLWIFMYFVEFLGNGPTVIG
jgi:halocyanin-like protein